MPRFIPHPSLLFALLTLGLSACAGLNIGGVQPPLVSLTDLKLQNAGLFAQEYQLQLQVQNPNPFPLPVRGLDYSLKLNGQNFARGVSNMAASIPAFGSQRMDLSVSSNVARIVQQINTFSKGGNNRFSYTLSGNFYLSDNPVGLAFEYSDQIDLDW